MGQTALAGSACWQFLTWMLNPAPLVVLQVDASQRKVGCWILHHLRCLKLMPVSEKLPPFWNA